MREFIESELSLVIQDGEDHYDYGNSNTYAKCAKGNENHSYLALLNLWCTLTAKFSGCGAAQTMLSVVIAAESAIALTTATNSGDAYTHDSPLSRAIIDLAMPTHKTRSRSTIILVFKYVFS